MARKEIKFRNNRGTHEGRQDGVIYRIVADRTLLGTAAPAYTVDAYDTKGKGRTISTRGHFRWNWRPSGKTCPALPTTFWWAGSAGRAYRMGEENKATEMVVCLDGKPVGICEEIPTLTELEPVAGAETIAGGTVTAEKLAEVTKTIHAAFNALAPAFEQLARSLRRIRKKYAKRILAWYREEVAPPC